MVRIKEIVFASLKTLFYLLIRRDTSFNSTDRGGGVRLRSCKEIRNQFINSNPTKTSNVKIMIKIV